MAAQIGPPLRDSAISITLRADKEAMVPRTGDANTCMRCGIALRAGVLGLALSRRRFTRR
jgi:hypothetical protein